MKNHSKIMLVVLFVVALGVSAYCYYSYSNRYDKNDKLKDNVMDLNNNKITLDDEVNNNKNTINEDQEENERVVNTDVVDTTPKTDEKTVKNETETKKEQNNVSNKTNTNKSSQKSSSNNQNSNKVTENATKGNTNNSNSQNDTQSNNEKIESNTSNEKQNDNSSEPKEDTTKKEETEKTVTIEIEVPEQTSFKDEPAYKNLMKEIYETEAACNKKGYEILYADPVNTSSFMCGSVNYKGAEVGWELSVRYVDGSWKKIKKNG